MEHQVCHPVHRSPSVDLALKCSNPSASEVWKLETKDAEHLSINCTNMVVCKIVWPTWAWSCSYICFIPVCKETLNVWSQTGTRVRV